MSELTPKQARFVEEYLLDANAREAARRAGYNEMIGYRLMRRPEVADAVRRQQAARAVRMQLSADMVIAELAAIAFSDIRRVVSWGGAEVVDVEDGEATSAPGGGRYGFRLRRSAELEPQTGAAISEFHRYSHGALKIRMHDKLPALMLLGRHLGLFGPGAKTAAQIRAEKREAEDEERQRRLAALPPEKRQALMRAIEGVLGK